MTDKKQLSDALNALREEIQKLSAEQSRKQSLIELADQIQQAADNTGDTENNGLIHSLEDTINEFEVEHPDLTAIINRILVTLGNMGI
ncbi:MAG: DUF4404 family protein [Gammaproteobacteria bacterium]|nr:DUF4404 family protein [Gammaproteobacteria bacterium]